MKKIEKWLVAINDMVEEPTTYLLHTRSPRFLIEIKDLDLNSTPKTGVIAESLVYINSESLPELYELEIIQVYESEEPEKLKKQLHLAVKWYRQYLKWEDGGHSGYLPDFNEQTPGLKLLYSEYADKWIVIYKGVVQIFKTEPEMDQYLYSLNFTDDQLEKGHIFKIGNQ